MSTPHLEAKVGAFVIGTAALLIAFVLLLGHVRLSPGFPLFVDFSYAGTLQPGAAVKVSGIGIGQVTRLALVDSTAKPPPADVVAEAGRRSPVVLRAELSLDQAAQPHLHPQSTFAVATQGVIGEAYLELIPGPPGDAPEAGSVRRGVDAPRLYEMATHLSLLLGAGAEIAGQPSAAGAEPGPAGAAPPPASAAAPLPGPAGAPPSSGVAAAPLPGPAAGPQALGPALGRLVATVDDLLRDRREALGTGIDRLAAASGDVARLTASLSRAVGEGQQLHDLLEASQQASHLLRTQLPTLLQQSRGSLTALEQLTQRANDSFDAPTVAQLLGEAKDTLRSLQSTVGEAQAMVRATHRGEGTVGGFLQDPEIYDDVKELMRDLKRHPWKIIWK